jgi:hypothetical protein
LERSLNVTVSVTQNRIFRVMKGSEIRAVLGAVLVVRWEYDYAGYV